MVDFAPVRSAAARPMLRWASAREVNSRASLARITGVAFSATVFVIADG
jgi:hypothetical protein